MTMPKLLPPGHPDRALSAQEVIEPHYQELVRRMKLRGMSEGEIAVAIEGLAQAHLMTLIENRATEAQIDDARAEAGLEPVYRGIDDDVLFQQLECAEPPKDLGALKALASFLAVMSIIGTCVLIAWGWVNTQS